MRRIVIMAGSLLASLVLLVAPAQATYHLTKVNEMMLASSSGDAGVQFVELLNLGGAEEQFTPLFGPYTLMIYGAAGNLLAEQTLNPNGLRAAAMTGREYLVSTSAADTAFHVSGDERLTVTLPTSAGQACFGGSPQPSSVSCLSWGMITKPVPINPVGSGSANGSVPPSGESDQRQADNSIIAACPTPKAPNSSKACATAPPAPFTGISFAAHVVKVDRRGRALVRLHCPAGTDGSCRGTLTLRAIRRRAKFGQARFQITSSTTATIRVKLSSATLKQLRRHGKLNARATTVARDAAGTSKTTAPRITLVSARSSHNHGKKP
jgi:hypothetical protein